MVSNDYIQLGRRKVGGGDYGPNGSKEIMTMQ
jgi:hypothetical protein